MTTIPSTRRPAPAVPGRLAAMLSLPLLLAACGGDGTGPGEVLPAELVATWAADPACLPACGFTLSHVANPSDSLNITSAVGISTEITLTRNGTFRMRTRPGPDTASTAKVRAQAGMLIVTDAMGTVDTLDYTVTASTLNLRFRRTFAVFDFTGDGVPDPAHARGAFRKCSSAFCTEFAP
jgi:hypothetical protein